MAEAMPVIEPLEALFVNIIERQTGGIIGSALRQHKDMIDLLQRVQYADG